MYVFQIQDLFNVRSPAQIVPSIRKMERVIQAVIYYTVSLVLTDNVIDPEITRINSGDL